MIRSLAKWLLSSPGSRRRVTFRSAKRWSSTADAGPCRSCTAWRGEPVGRVCSCVIWRIEDPELRLPNLKWGALFVVTGLDLRTRAQSLPGSPDCESVFFLLFFLIVIYIVCYVQGLPRWMCWVGVGVWGGHWQRGTCQAPRRIPAILPVRTWGGCLCRRRPPLPWLGIQGWWRTETGCWSRSSAPRSCCRSCWGGWTRR